MQHITKIKTFSSKTIILLICILICFLFSHQLPGNTTQSLVTISKSTNLPQKPITNYWQHIKDLHEEGNTYRDSISSQRISPRKFPFELFRELKPNEFLRACREAVHSAREEGRKNSWTEQEILGKTFENLSLVLEYYCIYVEKPQEVDFLLNAIGAEQEDTTIRLFLLKQLNSTPSNESLFSTHFKKLVKDRKNELVKILTIIIKRVNEKPEILAEAIPYFYSFIYEEYTEVLKKDSVIQAFAYTNNTEITPLILSSQNLPKILDKTQAEVEKLNRLLYDFLKELDRMSQSKNNLVKRESEQTKEKIYNNFPVNKG